MSELESILAKAGILESPPQQIKQSSSINEQMDDVGLTNQALFTSLAEVLMSGEGAAVKLRAIDMAFRAKLIGAASNANNNVQAIQIIINDPGQPAVKVNPILLPREILEHEKSTNATLEIHQ